MKHSIKWLRKLFKNSKGIRLLLEEAKSFEANGEFEAACYSYACAIDLGEEDQSLREKVKSLFNIHGPFSFEKQLVRMKQEFCSCDETCGEGYHIGIVKFIRKIADTA